MVWMCRFRKPIEKKKEEDPTKQLKQIRRTMVTTLGESDRRGGVGVRSEGRGRFPQGLLILLSYLLNYFCF